MVLNDRDFFRDPRLRRGLIVLLAWALLVAIGTRAAHWLMAFVWQALTWKWQYDGGGYFRSLPLTLHRYYVFLNHSHPLFSWPPTILSWPSMLSWLQDHILYEPILFAALFAWRRRRVWTRLEPELAVVPNVADCFARKHFVGFLIATVVLFVLSFLLVYLHVFTVAKFLLRDPGARLVPYLGETGAWKIASIAKMATLFCFETALAAFLMLRYPLWRVALTMALWFLLRDFFIVGSGQNLQSTGDVMHSAIVGSHHKMPHIAVLAASTVACLAACWKLRSLLGRPPGGAHA